MGGGIAGLTAAHLLADTHDVVVLEQADRVGGKLRRDEVAGVLVDTGAEAMLNRRPEGVELARDLGLEVVHPALASSRIWTRGALRPLPRSMMGVPLDLAELAASGVLSAEGLERVRREPSLPPYSLEGDPSVGDLVAERLGDEVVERLVEPLLGGVYAGHARRISARAALPQLVAYAERGSLLEQAAAMPVTYDRPVFAGIPGGMGLLPDALAASGRFEVRTGVTVRRVVSTGSTSEGGVVSTGSTSEGGGVSTGSTSEGGGSTSEGGGFRLTVGPTTGPELFEADRVVLATPAAATARLLADLAPGAARELAGIESASVAVVTFAFRSADVPAVVRESSGFLVPPVEGRAIKASTFSATKWGWVADAGRAAGGLTFLRTSLGRAGEQTALQVPDEELVRRSREDLAEAIGLTAEPVDTHVQRWGGGLPQYAPGHLDRVARVRAAVAAVPGLSVCGAAYDGVGVPAVIGSARRATMEA